MKQIVIPQYSIEQDPRVLREAGKHRELMSRLATVRTEHSRLVEERATLQQSRHEADVAHQLGDADPASADLVARLTELHDSIAELVRQAGVLEAAVAAQSTRIKNIRRTVHMELREVVLADVKAAIAQQAVHFAAIEVLQQKLTAAHRSGVVTNEINPVFFQSLALLPKWKTEARLFCGVTLEPNNDSRSGVRIRGI